MRLDGLGASFWDGYGRGVLRVGLGVVCASNLVGAAVQVWGDRPSALSHPQAPAFLIALGGSVWVWPLGLVGLIGLGHFAAAPGRRAGAAAALVVMALLVEADAALDDGPKRHFFAPGLALLGWLAGLQFARLLRVGEARAAEAYAEMGVVGALAGNYVDAAWSKLSHVGAQWANDTTLRAVILTHHSVGDGSLVGSYAHWVAGEPRAAEALAVATLAVQGGACLLLVGRHVRLGAGLALFAFHLNVELLADIGYGPARAVLLWFCLPIPQVAERLFRRRPRWAAPLAPLGAPSAPIGGRQLARATALGALTVVAAVLVARALPIRAYAALHHPYTGPRTAAPPPR